VITIFYFNRFREFSETISQAQPDIRTFNWGSKGKAEIRIMESFKAFFHPNWHSQPALIKGYRHHEFKRLMNINHSSYRKALCQVTHFMIIGEFPTNKIAQS
jgi:hypothetical protein